MQLITLQNHITIKTGIEDIIEPDWADLDGNITIVGLKYSESERQCPNKKGAVLKIGISKNNCIEQKSYHFNKASFTKKINIDYNGK